MIMDLANRINIALILLLIKEIFGYETEDLSDALIHGLYKKYKEAINRDGDLVILRRQFDQNQLFEIHVKKLKEVNGFKLHNLMIKGRVRSGSPIIYINNPVESKMPNAYLTLEEFKEALTKRVQKRKQTTLRFIDVFFTTKKNRKHVYERKSTDSTKINVTKVSKVTKAVIQSLSKATLQKEKASSIISTNTTTHNNISKSSTTVKSLENHSSTEKIARLNLQNNVTVVQIEDLLFLRTSGETNNYTETERYSNMSVSTIEYDNSTTQRISKLSMETINNTADTNSYLQMEKSNKTVLSLVSSVPNKITKIKLLSTVNTPISISNKTNDNHNEVADNMTTDHSTFKRTDTDNHMNITIVKNPEISTTVIFTVSTRNITSEVSYNNTYIMINTSTEVLRTVTPENNSEDLVNATTDLLERTTESINDISKQYIPEINNKTYTENTKLDTKTTLAVRVIDDIVETQKETFVTNTTELKISKSSILTNSSTISASSKKIPKRKINPEPLTVRTPWRRRTTKRFNTKSMTKTKRSTLGRPLVFMGGP